MARRSAQPIRNAVDERRLLDVDAEAVRRSHSNAIRELQSTPASSLKVIPDIELPDGVPVLVSHGLTHPPHWVGVSVPRGAVAVGVIVEEREGIDRARSLQLTASSYGATITVDVLVI